MYNRDHLFDDLEEIDLDAPAAPAKYGTPGAFIAPEPESQYVEKCRACGGTGRFTSWSGRVVGKCFKCDGRGEKSFRTSPEQRAKSRKQAVARKERQAAEAADAAEQYLAEHDLLDWVKANEGWSEWVAKTRASVVKYGSLTPKWLASAESAREKWLAKQASREAERAASAAERLDLTDVPAGRYAVPGGETRLKIRINKPSKGKWVGWVFVDDGAEYGNRQSYGRQAPDGVYVGKLVEQLKAIAADPKAAMAAYGHLVGHCGVCNRLLEDEESVARGIGPICAQKYGW